MGLRPKHIEGWRYVAAVEAHRRDQAIDQSNKGAAAQDLARLTVEDVQVGFASGAYTDAVADRSDTR